MLSLANGFPSRHQAAVIEFATRLSVSRGALSRVVTGRVVVKAKLTIRLSVSLGGSAESWLQMQSAYDLYQASEEAPGRKLSRLDRRRENR